MINQTTNNYSTTIMFTDIVGYSSLFGGNEEIAMNILKKHDELIIPIINRHRGKIIKHMGDSIFTSYTESIDAVKCAIDIQEEIFKRNEIKNQKEQFKIRVGIHCGEIIEKNKDLFGNVVNVASRIEGICIAGGVAISDAVHKKIDEKIGKL